MTEKSKKPRLRFKGFTEAWEQRKLGDVAVKVTEKNTQNTIKETFTNSAEMGVISQRDFFDHDIAKADKIDGYYIVQENDFIYNPRISAIAPCGPINRNKLGRKGVMSPLYTVFRTNNIDPLFLEWYFKSSCWYAYMYFNGDSGARSDRFSIKSELFFDMPIPSPNEGEQGRVGLLLETVNKLITLHQRKYDKFVAIKKALLEKMFPRAGKSVPEIRFKGFTETWEQCKLGDSVEVCSGKDYKHLRSGDIPVYGTGGYMLSVNEALSYNQDAIGIGRKGTIDKPYVLNAPFWTVDTLFYAILKKNNDLSFMFSIFQKVDWKSKDESTGVPSLSKNTINDVDIIIPILEEQSKIGSIFSSIDNLITLHQRQLEKLKNIKSALLEKMFV